MAGPPLGVLRWLLAQPLLLPCRGVSLDVAAGRGWSSGRGAAGLWQAPPAALDRASGGGPRSNPDDGCLDAEEGDKCHGLVTWCLEEGLEEHPEWFTAFRRSASRERNFKQIQGILHGMGKGGCGRPCSTLVEQLQHAQDAKDVDFVHTTAPVEHPPRVWVATAPPTTSLEAPKAEVQEAPEVEAPEAPGGEAREAPQGEGQEVPESRAQEAPEVEAREAPRGEVKEEAGAEIREGFNAESADGSRRPGGPVTTGGDLAAPEAHGQARDVGTSSGIRKQETEEATRPEAKADTDGFIIDGYGQGGQWAAPMEES